jgi:hypothetical protein
LYSEPDFFIRKIDDTHFSVTSKNGLNAMIAVHDHIMFVDTSFEYINSIHIGNAANVSRTSDNSFLKYVGYCTPMNETVLTVDDFVVQNIKNNLLFKLNKRKISKFFKKYDDFFKENLPITLYSKLIKSDTIIKFLNYDEYAQDDQFTEYNCLYEYHVFNKKSYPSIVFSRKKVVDKIFKYSFKAKKIREMAKKEKVVAYYVDGMFFDLCDLETFFFNKENRKSSGNIPFMRYNSALNFSMPADKKDYGIRGQLTDDYETYVNKIDISKVLLLRHEGEQYCLLKKENRRLTLSYITNFDINTTILDGFLSYTSWWQKTLRNEQPLRRYQQEKLITFTYFNGKIKSKKERFTLAMVAEHEMSLTRQVNDHMQSLSVCHPSDLVINSLRELGMPFEVPLNPDDLTVLEMFEI